MSRDCERIIGKHNEKWKPGAQPDFFEELSGIHYESIWYWGNLCEQHQNIAKVISLFSPAAHDYLKLVDDFVEYDFSQISSNDRAQVWSNLSVDGKMVYFLTNIDKIPSDKMAETTRKSLAGVFLTVLKANADAGYMPSQKHYASITAPKN